MKKKMKKKFLKSNGEKRKWLFVCEGIKNLYETCDDIRKIILHTSERVLPDFSFHFNIFKLHFFRKLLFLLKSMSNIASFDLAVLSKELFNNLCSLK